MSALDVSIQGQVINLLEDLQQKLGLSYLFIAHDLAVVRHISHKVAVMYLGKIVEYAPADELFANPQHPYTQALLAAAPIPDPAIERTRPRRIITGELPSPLRPPPGCVFNPRCPIAVESCRKEIPELRSLAPAIGSPAARCRSAAIASCALDALMTLTGRKEEAQFKGTEGGVAMKFKTSLLAVPLAAAFAVGGTGGHCRSPQTPKKGGILKFVVPDEPPSFDGHSETTFALIHPIAPFYSVLIRVNPDNPAFDATSCATCAPRCRSRPTTARPTRSRSARA